jgi:glutaredoxin 3
MAIQDAIMSVQAKVEIYSSPWCGYCYRAKQLLEGKGVSFTEIDVMEQPVRRDEMVTRAGGRTTVPQIFINGKWVGGSDDLYALDKAGKLDPLLAEEAA